MLFHEVAPSREECTSQIEAALQAERGRIYLDANVLIHCFEMSAAASGDLLQGLTRYSDRVGIPVWAANETWEHLRDRIQRKPLQKLAGRVDSLFRAVSSDTARYVDDQAVNDMTRDEFRAELTTSLDAVSSLVGKIRHHEPSIDETTSRLLPFIESQRLDSDLPRIIEAVRNSADFRTAHQIPPGFRDPPQVSEDDEKTVRKKGKSRNPNGDLIIWLEILEDCRKLDASHLVVVTQDVTKGDWVYIPERVRDQNGRPQSNSTGLTLALPLLVYEAKKTCPSLESVQVITVEMLAQVWSRQRMEVSHLAAALQAEDGPAEAIKPAGAQTAGGELSDDQYAPSFRSSDMGFEPDPEKPIDAVIGTLPTEGWKGQNKAVRDLEPQLHSFGREQLIQIGRGLVAAASQGAVEPAEMLARVLTEKDVAVSTKSDVLVGALAAVFIAESGEPKKPSAKSSVIDALFEAGLSGSLEPAFEAVLSRLKAIRTEYLTLPNEPKKAIDVEIILDKDVLVNLLAGDVELLEEDAPKNRTLLSTGRDIEMTVRDLFELVAEEFVVPDTWFVSDLDLDTTLIVPDHIGFIAWGPRTGVSLR